MDQLAKLRYERDVKALHDLLADGRRQSISDEDAERIHAIVTRLKALYPLGDEQQRALDRLEGWLFADPINEIELYFFSETGAILDPLTLNELD